MRESNETPNHWLVLRLVAGAFLFIASFAVIRPLGEELGLHGAQQTLLMLIPAVAAVLFFRFDRRIERARGRASPHLGLFQARYVACIAAHIVLLILVDLADDLHWVSGMGLAGLSTLPAVPLLGLIYVFGRNLVDEPDEYQRMQKVQAGLWATGLLMVVATVWGALEQHGFANHVPASAAFYIWFMGMGLAKAALKFRE